MGVIMLMRLDIHTPPRVSTIWRLALDLARSTSPARSLAASPPLALSLSSRRPRAPHRVPDGPPDAHQQGGRARRARAAARDARAREAPLRRRRGHARGHRRRVGGARRADGRREHGQRGLLRRRGGLLQGAPRSCFVSSEDGTGRR